MEKTEELTSRECVKFHGSELQLKTLEKDIMESSVVYFDFQSLSLSVSKSE